MAGRRPSGDGLVRKRKDGRWEGRIMVGRDQEGKPIYRSVVDKSQKEMLEKLHGLIEAYREVELTDRKNYTLGEWLDKWLNEIMAMHLRPSTMKSYQNIINYRIKPFLGDVPLHKVSRPDVQRMYVKIKKSGRVEEHAVHGDELSDSAVRSTHMLLHQAMDYAVRERLILENPTNGTKIPKVNYAPMKVLDDAQLDAFMEVIKQDPIWYDFFYTELTTGLRRGEMCGLMWQDFNPKNGTLQVKRQIVRISGEGISVNEPKTKTGTRLIYLPPSTVELLKERKKHSYSRWIFPNPYSPEAPMGPEMPYNRLKTLLRYAGVPPVRFHDLRHTYATMSLEHGMDVKTLSATLGHVSAATTLDIYSHVTSTMQKQAAVNIEKAIGKTDVEYTPEEPKPVPKTDFQPYKLRYRKSGTGMVRQISDNLWEGRYSPRDAHGKRISKNIYAKTEQECEDKLKVLIEEMKAEIKAEKALLKAQESGMTITM